MVAREGYLQSTVAEVIAHAGAARSTFYEQFADLEGCMLMALDRLAEELLERVVDALQSNTYPWAGHALLGAFLGFAGERPAPARVLFVESLAAGVRARERRDRMIADAAELLAGRWLASGTNGETAGGGPDLPAAALVGGLARLCAARLPTDPTGFQRLQAELELWLDSYTPDHGGDLRWREPSRSRLPLTIARPGVREAAAPVGLPRGRHRLGSAQMDANRRERILYALPKLAYERGYTNLTVAEIAAAAGVSRNSFYTNFSDKRAAATALLELSFERSMSAAAGAFFAATEWPERMWAAGETLERYYLAHPYQSHLAFVELHAIGAQAVAMAYERLMGFTLLFEDAYNTYPYAHNLPRISSEILALSMFEFGYREAPRPTDVDPERLLPQRVYMCLAPFLGPQRASEFVAGKVDS